MEDSVRESLAIGQFLSGSRRFSLSNPPHIEFAGLVLPTTKHPVNYMKPILSKTKLLALLAVLSGSAVNAGDLPVSPTSGIMQISLPISKTTSLAVPYAKSIPLEGTITSVSGTTLGLSTAMTDSSLTNHAIYITTKINQSETGAYGRLVGISSNTTSSVVTASAITPSVGDAYQIIEQHTLSSLFGQLGTYSLQSGNSVALSDIVSVEVGGVFTSYWHKTSTGWRLTTDTAGSGADQANVSINFGRGVLVARKAFGGAKLLNIKGEAIVGRFQPSVTSNATNLVNNPFLLQTSLGASGISDFITKGSTVSLSDTVTLEENGVFTNYWFKNGVGWRLSSDTAGTGADQAAVLVKAGKAILFRDRLAAGFAIQQPFAN